jgi:hypothetical protein
VRFLEGGVPEGIIPRVFLNLRRMHDEYRNLPFFPLCKQLSFDFLASFPFCRKEIIFHGNVGTYKIGEHPWHNALEFFCLGTSLKIHIEIKMELFT